MKTETQIDKLIDNAKSAMTELHAALLPISAFHDGKYASVTLEASGTGPVPSVEMKSFIADGLHIRSDSARGIFKALADYSPLLVKQQKIERLKSELAALESEVAK